MAQHAAIIGDGAMATVCALTLHDQGIGVSMWSPDPAQSSAMIQTRENRRYLPGYPLPEPLRFSAEEDAAFAGADFVVSAIQIGRAHV